MNLQLYKQYVQRLLFACFFITAFSALSSAQIYYNDFVRSDRQWEFDLNAGPTNFLGDVGGGKGKGTFFLKDINTSVTSIFFGGNLTYYPNQWLGIKVGFNTGKVSGFDSLISNQGDVERDRKNRNLGFRSPITEGYVAMEIYPTAFLSRRESFFNNKLRPYVNIGIGFTSFNPQGQYEDPLTGRKTWVDLRPLRLEGQGMSEYPDRKMYSKTALMIPFGFGIKYFVSENWYVAAEIMQRYTFTDYIDDVSKTYIDPNLFDKYLPKDQAVIAKQMMFKRALVNNRPVSQFVGKARGDETNNDYYLSVFLKLGFKFGSRDTDQSCPRARF